MKNAAVFFGGKSCEHEISILTGVFVLNLVDREKFNPVPVYIGTDGRLYSSSKMFSLDAFKRETAFQRVILEEGTLYRFHADKCKLKRALKLDVAINCCHGGWGEGGGVSALTEQNGLPLASPSLAPSALFLDKTLTKLIAKALGIPTVDYLKVNECDYNKRGAFFLKSVGARLGFPVVVKPAQLGSSIGITLAENEAETKTALEAAFALDHKALVEKFLDDKRDVNCAAYLKDGEIFVSEPEEASNQAGIYSFSDKYVKPRAEEKKRPIEAELRGKIRAYTRTLYKRTNMRGVVRMDFLVSGGEAYLGEVNTVPGSLAYYLFCERLSDAKTFFSDLLTEALKTKEEKKLVHTGVLETVRGGRKRGHFGVRI